MDLMGLLASLRRAREQNLLAAALGVFGPEELFAAIVDEVGQVLAIDRFDYLHLRPEEGERTIKILPAKNWLASLQRSARGQAKIGVVWGADKLTPDAANSLLKTLEEPPDHTYLLLLAERDNLLPTVRSRLQSWHLGEKPDESQINIPDSVSDIIKTAALWQKERVTRARLRQVVIEARQRLRAGEMTAVQAERIHRAYINEHVGLNQRLLVESILLNPK